MHFMSFPKCFTQFLSTVYIDIVAQRFDCLQRESRGWDYWNRKRKEVQQGARKPLPENEKEPRTQKVFQGN